MGQEDIGNKNNRFTFPEIKGSTIREIYGQEAVAIENHPNYQIRKSFTVPFGMRLGQYVDNLKKRAEENYTNETQEKHAENFKIYWEFLNK